VEVDGLAGGEGAVDDVPALAPVGHGADGHLVEGDGVRGSEGAGGGSGGGWGGLSWGALRSGAGCGRGRLLGGEFRGVDLCQSCGREGERGEGCGGESGEGCEGEMAGEGFHARHANPYGVGRVGRVRQELVG
jgi:hypothetical protein